MKADIYILKIRTIGILLSLITTSFGLVAQSLCDQEGCITASLVDFTPGQGLETISGYEDIGNINLFCGYEDAGTIVGIFAELEAGGSNPIWSFNGNPSGDPFDAVTSDGVIIIEVTTDVSSCSCQVILNPPAPPQVNNIVIPLCGDGNTVNFDVNDIDKSTIATGSIVIAYYLTMSAANTSNQDFAINDNIDVSSGDKIFARVEDINGASCFSVAEVNFTVSQNPILNLTSDVQTLNCNNPQATIDANPSGGTPYYSYDWATNNGTIIGNTDEDALVISSAGTYTVLLTDDNGCIAIGEVTINQNVTTPEFGATSISTPDGTEINCDINELSLTTNATSPDGSSPSYEWTTTDGNISGDTDQAMTTITAAGTYTVTVIHPTTGCTVNDNVVITEVNELPTPEITPNNPTLTCILTEITLMGSSSGVPPLTYAWSTGEETPSINVTMPDTYTLTVTDGNGCAAIRSTVVDESLTAPTPTIVTPEIITCNNATVDLDASDSEIIGIGATYEWTTNDGNIVSGSSTDIATVDASGTYQIEITNDANGCTATAMIMVTENIAIPTVNTDTLRACSDPGTDIAQFDLTETNINNESGTNTIYYENSNLTSEITNPENYQSSGGTIYGSVEFNDNGCASVAEITLSVQPIDVPPNLFETYFGSICTSQTITVAPPPNTPYNYSWSSIPDGKVLEGTESTALNIDQEAIVFSIEISDDSGCFEVVIFPPLDLTVAPSGAKVFRFANTNTLFCNINNFDSYQWGKESKTTLSEEPMAGETFPDVVIQDLDTDTYYYWVKVTHDGNCTTKFYLDGENNSPFGKLVVDPNIEYGNLALQVNPNPNNGAFELIITGDEIRDLDVHVYDALGCDIYHQKAPKIAGKEIYYIAPPNLTQGLYFVRVTGNNDILLSTKIIVK